MCVATYTYISKSRLAFGTTLLVQLITQETAISQHYLLCPMTKAPQLMRGRNYARAPIFSNHTAFLETREKDVSNIQVLV